jgi:hypothetical protein
LQHRNISFRKAPREIARRRRVENPFGSQTIQEHLVLAPQINVFQPLPSGQ